jgi:3,4-dihydroxy 2-butanone 4-phosphate synthase/GTP cyclohydrolase II
MSVRVRLDTVERAIADIAAGRAVVVVDDEDRENEGDLVFAASRSTPELMAFTIRYSSGVICAPMEAATLDRLGIPLMTPHNRDRHRTAYTVSVDARDGVTTGISAADRSHTVRVLNDSATEPFEVTQPGHVFPLRYTEGGVLARPGHTEAAVDLARIAGHYPAGVLAEIMNDDGSVARLPELMEFAREHDLLIGTIADLIAHRRSQEKLVERVVEARIPTEYGTFTAVGYRSLVDDRQHIALVMGDLGDGESVLTRVHSECLTGDVFGSLRCDCGEQLDQAMARVAEEGRGVVLYIRGHEGRGIGLLHKLAAYKLQDEGFDTVDANVNLGLPVDARDYGVGAQILYDLGVRSMRIMTNNPTKRAGIEGYGLSILEQVPLFIDANDENRGYLLAKATRLGHQMDMGQGA